jgi:hypothetical protein
MVIEASLANNCNKICVDKYYCMTLKDQFLRHPDDGLTATASNSFSEKS